MEQGRIVLTRRNMKYASILFEQSVHVGFGCCGVRCSVHGKKSDTVLYCTVLYYHQSHQAAPICPFVDFFIMKQKHPILLITLAFVLNFVMVNSVQAYIGPGIACIGYLLGPVAAVVALVGMTLYLPIKSLLKRYKRNKESKAVTAEIAK